MISYKEVGCLINPSPKSIPVKKSVSFPYVNSFVPLKKQPMRPMIIPRIIGKVNKSPEDCFSLIIFFDTSTPIKPPNNPPIMDFVLSKSNMFSDEKSIIGFSKKPISLEPTNEPIIAPKIIESRLLLEIVSITDLRNLT